MIDLKDTSKTSPVEFTEAQLKDFQNSQKEFFRQVYMISCEVLEGGKLPTKAHATDAGFDLYATEDIVLYPGQVIKHPLNIKLKLPSDTWAEITTKSGLGSKGQLVYAGVIDEEYRGVPHVIMTNLKMFESGLPIATEDAHLTGKVVNQHGMVRNLDPILIKKGEKVAQLIMNSHSQFYFVEQVEKVETDTNRGEGGFGSTGR